MIVVIVFVGVMRVLLLLLRIDHRIRSIVTRTASSITSRHLCRRRLCFVAQGFVLFVADDVVASVDSNDRGIDRIGVSICLRWPIRQVGQHVRTNALFLRNRIQDCFGRSLLLLVVCFE